MTTLPRRTPLGPVFAQFGRLLRDTSQRRPHLAGAPLPHDPEFLPDFATQTPDQAQEMRYGLGRSSSNTIGCGR